MTKIRYCVFTAIMAVGVAAAGGCGTKPTSVHGVVTCQGKPLTGAEVLFAPDAGTVGKPVAVSLDSRGEFLIEDAVVGTHKIRIYPTLDDEDGGRPLTCKAPADLTFVVEPGVVNEFSLEL